nr:ParB N-terminal domain-containing protein [Saccharothrix ecbatanensis]
MSQSSGALREPVPLPTSTGPVQNRVDETPTRLRISEIEAGISPRLGGTDENHIRLLAGVASPLPPILVHRETMRVIDGMHRLTAARLNGADEIEVKFFHGSDAEAFLLAVQTNTAHGLPLTGADRQAATIQIIAAYPELSDRAVAAIAGLSARTVSGIRKRTGAPPSRHRLGRDGRVRPLSTAEGRRTAGQLFANQPQLSLREVAARAGISVSTARDVRMKMSTDGRDEHPATGDVRSSHDHSQTVTALPEMRSPGLDLQSMVDGLRRDPSIRYSERGQGMLRWLALRAITVSQYRQIIDGLPPHITNRLARIAREYAAVWTGFADELDSRNAESG